MQNETQLHFNHFFLVGVGNEARNRTFSLLFCTFKIAIYASLNQCRSTHCAAIAARTTHQGSTSFRSAFECTHCTCAEILGATGTSESICFTIVTLHCCTLAAIGMYSIFPTEESESLAILVHFIATIVVPFFFLSKKKHAWHANMYCFTFTRCEIDAYRWQPVCAVIKVTLDKHIVDCI